MELINAVGRGELDDVIRLLENPEYDVNQEAKYEAHNWTYTTNALTLATEKVVTENAVYLDIIKHVMRHPTCDVNYVIKGNDCAGHRALRLYSHRRVPYPISTINTWEAMRIFF